MALLTRKLAEKLESLPGPATQPAKPTITSLVSADGNTSYIKPLNQMTTFLLHFLVSEASAASRKPPLRVEGGVYNLDLLESELHGYLIEVRSSTSPQRSTLLKDLESLISDLTTDIDRYTKELSDVEVSLKEKRDGEGWVRRTFWDTKEVDALEATFDSLQKRLTRAHGLRGGAYITSQILMDSDPVFRPEYWRKKFEQRKAYLREERDVRGVVLIQKEIAQLTQDAKIQADAAQKDLHYLKEFNFAYKRGFFGCSSIFRQRDDKEWIYHRGEQLDQNRKKDLDDFKTLLCEVELTTADAVNELLKKENPQYRAERSYYDVLSPVQDELQKALSSTKETLRILSDLTKNIQQCEEIEKKEPTTKTTLETTITTTTDDKGNTQLVTSTSIEDTDEYVHWRDSHNLVLSNISEARAKLIQSIDELNKRVQLPELRMNFPQLESFKLLNDKQGNVLLNSSSHISKIARELVDWALLRFSIEKVVRTCSGQVEMAKINGLKSQLEGKLESLKMFHDVMKPKYDLYQQKVNEQMRNRREELLK